MANDIVRPDDVPESEQAARKFHRVSPATGIALLALGVALSGTAWAASTGKPPPAKGNAKYLGGVAALNFTQNVWANETSQPLKVESPKDPQVILQQPFVNSLPNAIGFLNFAEAQVTNEDQKDAVTVTLAMTVNGKAEPGSYEATIGAGETQSIFSVLKCNGLPKGRSLIGLTLQTNGSVLIGTRADDALRPIVVPPGGHSSRFSGEG
jgi:hypothetical protein